MTPPSPTPLESQSWLVTVSEQPVNRSETATITHFKNTYIQISLTLLAHRKLDKVRNTKSVRVYIPPSQDISPVVRCSHIAEYLWTCNNHIHPEYWTVPCLDTLTHRSYTSSLSYNSSWRTDIWNQETKCGLLLSLLGYHVLMIWYYVKIYSYTSARHHK